MKYFCDLISPLSFSSFYNFLANFNEHDILIKYGIIIQVTGGLGRTEARHELAGPRRLHRIITSIPFMRYSRKFAND